FARFTRKKEWQNQKQIQSQIHQNRGLQQRQETIQRRDRQYPFRKQRVVLNRKVRNRDQQSQSKENRQLFGQRTLSAAFCPAHFIHALHSFIKRAPTMR